MHFVEDVIEQKLKKKNMWSLALSYMATGNANWCSPPGGKVGDT